MSIRSRLLASVSSFLGAIEAGAVDDFCQSFSDLLREVKSATDAGTLSEDDRRLGHSVSSTIESIATELERVDAASSVIIRELGDQVDATLAVDDCTLSCAQLHDHTSSLVPFTRSPTPESPPDASGRVIHPTYARSSASASDDESDSDSQRNTTTKRRRAKKGGPENPANFRHLRDWFINHMDHPFPSSSEKKSLAAAKNLPLNSINLWFTNMRRRSGWTAAQTLYANGDAKLFKTIIAQINAIVPGKGLNGLPAKVYDEIDRIRGYIDERGQERVRDYMVGVINDGIEAAKDIDDDDFEDESDEENDDEGAEDGQHDGQAPQYVLGWGHAGDASAVVKRRISDGSDQFAHGQESKRGKRESGVGGEGRYLPSTYPDQQVSRKTSGESASTSSTWTDEAPTPHSYRSFSGTSAGSSNSPPFTASTSAPTPIEAHFLYPVATPSHPATADRPIAPLRSRSRTSSGGGEPSALSHYPPPAHHPNGPSPEPSQASSFGRPTSAYTDVYDRDYAGSPPKRLRAVSPTFHAPQEYAQDRRSSSSSHPRQYAVASPEYAHSSPHYLSPPQPQYYTSPQHPQHPSFHPRHSYSHPQPQPASHPPPQASRPMRRHATQPHPSQPLLTNAPMPMARSASYQHHPQPAYTTQSPPEGFTEGDATFEIPSQRPGSGGGGGGKVGGGVKQEEGLKERKERLRREYEECEREEREREREGASAGGGK